MISPKLWLQDVFLARAQAVPERHPGCGRGDPWCGRARVARLHSLHVLEFVVFRILVLPVGEIRLLTVLFIVGGLQTTQFVAVVLFATIPRLKIGIRQQISEVIPVCCEQVVLLVILAVPIHTGPQASSFFRFKRMCDISDEKSIF